MDTRWIELCGDAMDMDDGAVAQLETALLHDPENLALRVRLLGTLIRRSLPRGDQLRWLVQHHPELELGGFALLSRDQEPESYAAIRAIWQEHLAASPDSLALLERAAFFLGHEDPDCAVRLLQHAMTLQPDRARWPEQI
ncbi:MAG TPA: hypothetical protein VFZ61_09540, partial [Polyangiales bacterium]